MGRQIYLAHLLVSLLFCGFAQQAQAVSPARVQASYDVLKAGIKVATITETYTRTKDGYHIDSVTKAHGLLALFKAETIGLAKALTIGLGYQTSVGAMMNTTVGAFQTTQVGLYKNVTVLGGDYATSVPSGTKSITTGANIELTAKDEIKLTVGKSTLVMKSDGTITMNGKDVSFVASGEMYSEAKGDMVNKASNIKNNA